MASLYCVPGVLQPQYFIVLNSPKLYFRFFRLIKKSKIDKNETTCQGAQFGNSNMGTETDSTCMCFPLQNPEQSYIVRRTSKSPSIDSGHTD